MRIVIDLQAAQSQSRRRGIGRYSLALARAMCRQRGEHEIVVALNGMFGEDLGQWQEAFADVLPPQNVRVWHPLVPPMAVNGGPRGPHAAAQCVREAFLASLEPDFVHVTSVFESSPFAITEYGHPAWPLRTAVTLYDLIPLLNAQTYLDTPQKRSDYEAKLAGVRRADLLLAISESARQEALQALSFPPERVVTISSDADPHFTPGEVAPAREKQVRDAHGLTRPFAMYTGGIDPRKNVEGLVEAWSRLPVEVRAAHQLAIVCAVQPDERERLEALARQLGLEPGRDVVLTGYVPDDELADLYRLCRLFVFPSRHEGFGLPALEAMRCGAPVIGAGNSSIVEVIGLPDAMFDANDLDAMATLVARGLQDDAFRETLLANGRAQSRLFDWEESARRAIAAMEAAAAAAPVRASEPPARKPRLAFVSPMPPARSGIADSSAHLLPYLAAHYDIDLVTDQADAKVPDGAVKACRTPEWLDAHAHEYERIVYQFGNSSFHGFEFPLLAKHPGVVILHDFFLSGVLTQHEIDHPGDPAWTRALYASHGWPAVADRFRAHDLTEVIWRYPANFDVLARAEGIIVHSRHAQALAAQWYGPAFAKDVARVRLLRLPADALPRAEARARLGIAPGAFVACSFGHMGPTKLNLELLQAWRQSPLAGDAGCHLVFVGERHPADYDQQVQAEVEALGDKVRITGWVSDAQYEDWLAACDVAVQLRSLSRGETSAAVLDCMNHGVATVANAEGSMADLPPDAVWLLPAVVDPGELAHALTVLRDDAGRRAALGRMGQAIVRGEHSPAACAAGYTAAIEAFAARRGHRDVAVVDEAGRLLPADTPADFVAALARGIAQTFPPPRPSQRLLFTIAAADAPVPPLLHDLLHSTLPGWRVEPVYLDGEQRWRYARRATMQALDGPASAFEDDVLDLQTGDVWALPVEGEPAIPAVAAPLGIRALRMPPSGDAARIWAVIRALCAPVAATRWWMDLSELVVRDWGSGIQRVVKNHLFDLLLEPPEGVQVVPVYAKLETPGYRVARRYLFDWAGLPVDGAGDERALPVRGDVFFGLDLQPQVVPAQQAELAGFAANGVHVGLLVHDLLPIRMPQYFHPGATEAIARWLRVVAECDFAVCVSHATADDLQRWLREEGLPVPGRVRTVHNGADLGHMLGSQGLPVNAAALLEQVRARPSLLMVGTLEPRKCHAEVLAALDVLWARGEDVGFVIAGHAGWMVDELVERIDAHPEFGRRLLWIRDASDEFLQQVYGAAAALVAASRGEGFGLPLVEAAQYGLPLIARDLPVFREIAGDWAFYFTDDAPEPLASRLSEWLALWRAGQARATHDMPRSSWRESTRRLVEVLREVGAS